MGREAEGGVRENRRTLIQKPQGGVALRFFLAFPNKSLPAFGAGDGDLALAPGDSDGLPAPRTVKIAVLTILESVYEHEKPTIFPITLVGVPGEGAEDGPDHAAVGQQDQNQSHQHHPNKQRQQA